MHKYYVESSGHFYLNSVGYLSDGDMLVKALRESTFFHAVADDKEISAKALDIAYKSKFFDAA
jgi:hypothetical protein